MRTWRTIFLVLALAIGVLNSALLHAQISPDLLGKPWTAQWITCPNAPERDAFVFHFRRVLELPTPPPHFIVHVSADNQFLLYVNQQRVGTGPSRGDLAHWRFETYDLGPLLRSGRNILAATVWSFGTHSAIAQMSNRAGFLLQGDGLTERAADTNDSWEVEQEKGVEAAGGPVGLPEHFYFAAEPSERVNATVFDWMWNADPRVRQNTQWRKALPIGRGFPRGARDAPTIWQLVPDTLPPMAMELIAIGKVVRASAVESTSEFPDKPFVVPAHAEASLLLDASQLLTAFPELTVSGGAGASVRLTYAEALFDEHGKKSNRNEVRGKHIAGLTDEFLPDGPSRTFMPLTWRTWRFAQLDIKTADQALTVDRLRAWFTAYPFQERGRFASDDSTLASVWDVGWRTARLDAHDTYMDTPYWERLQYIGDTRIQALISYTVAGDDRLARQAIEAFDDSRIPDGITQSRYPSALPQFIPTFSLLWIGMVHDFWLYRSDRDFVRTQLSGTRTVLDWFREHQRPDGLLGKLPWWDFVDWADDFANGEPPQDVDGGSAVITLQFIEALRNAAEIETAIGRLERAEAYRDAAGRAAQGLLALCWNKEYRLLADTPAQKHFSEHANILGVWLDVIPRAQQRTVLTNILATSDAGFKGARSLPQMSQATYYFRFYLARALEHAGMGDEYTRLLQPWRDMIALGLTTWAEKNEPTRSDSHAWSAHPNFDLLTVVAGIHPGSPEFRTVTIEPHLGPLGHVEATMAHPKGDIRVEYAGRADAVDAIITLPEGLSGDFIWDANKYPLHEGKQNLTLLVKK